MDETISGLVANRERSEWVRAAQYPGQASGRVSPVGAGGDGARRAEQGRSAIWCRSWTGAFGLLTVGLGLFLKEIAGPMSAAEIPSLEGAAVPTNPPAASATALGFRQVDPDTYVLGLVTLHKRARTISFPVVINQRSNVVEYALVHETGKTHESILRTAAEPLHVHLAVLLLGATPANTNLFPEPASGNVPGTPMTIAVRWPDGPGSRVREVGLEELVAVLPDRRPLRRSSWVYNGSYVTQGRFVAAGDGSIVAVYSDPAALINTTDPSRNNDDIHFVNSVALPPEGRSLELVIGLAGAGTVDRHGRDASGPGSKSPSPDAAPKRLE